MFGFFKKFFKVRKNKRGDSSESPLNISFSDLNIRVGSSVTIDTSSFLLYNNSLDQSKIPSTETVQSVMTCKLFGLDLFRFYFKSNNFLQICKMEDGTHEALYFTESHSCIPDEWDEWLGEDGLMRGEEIQDDQENLYQKAWDQDCVEFVGNVTNSTGNESIDYDTMMFYRNISSIHDENEQTDEMLLVESSNHTRLSMYVGLEIDYQNIKIL